MEKRALKITDIAQMIYLAEGVLSAARFSVTDENGVMLHLDNAIKQLENDRENKTENPVEQLLHSVHDLNDAIETTPEEILTTLSPVKSRILGLFRNGEVITEFYPSDEMYAAPSVPDEWLLELFAMRVRDKIISFVMQEQAAKRAAEKGSK
ncbi:MAG: hypothetical protein HDT43_06365 [Ruminococcaceae bacterium]|nr:hypothetical protein [Oscillospiraceae bacterium]